MKSTRIQEPDERNPVKVSQKELDKPLILSKGASLFDNGRYFPSTPPGNGDLSPPHTPTSPPDVFYNYSPESGSPPSSSRSGPFTPPPGFEDYKFIDPLAFPRADRKRLFRAPNLVVGTFGNVLPKYFGFKYETLQPDLKLRKHPYVFVLEGKRKRETPDFPTKEELSCWVWLLIHEYVKGTGDTDFQTVYPTRDHEWWLHIWDPWRKLKEQLDIKAPILTKDDLRAMIADCLETNDKFIDPRDPLNPMTLAELDKMMARDMWDNDGRPIKKNFSGKPIPKKLNTNARRAKSQEFILPTHNQHSKALQYASSNTRHHFLEARTFLPAIDDILEGIVMEQTVLDRGNVQSRWTPERQADKMKQFGISSNGVPVKIAKKGRNAKQQFGRTDLYFKDGTGKGTNAGDTLGYFHQNFPEEQGYPADDAEPLPATNYYYNTAPLPDRHYSSTSSDSNEHSRLKTVNKNPEWTGRTKGARLVKHHEIGNQTKKPRSSSLEENPKRNVPKSNLPAGVVPKREAVVTKTDKNDGISKKRKSPASTSQVPKNDITSIPPVPLKVPIKTSGSKDSLHSSLGSDSEPDQEGSSKSGSSRSSTCSCSGSCSCSDSSSLSFSSGDHELADPWFKKGGHESPFHITPPSSPDHKGQCKKKKNSIKSGVTEESKIPLPTKNLSNDELRQLTDNELKDLYSSLDKLILQHDEDKLKEKKDILNTECYTSKGTQSRPQKPQRSKKSIENMRKIANGENSYGLKYTKDHVYHNARMNILIPPKRPFPSIVDDRKGTKYKYCFSGLSLCYVNKKDYGIIPDYLQERNKQLGRPSNLGFDRFYLPYECKFEHNHFHCKKCGMTRPFNHHRKVSSHCRRLNPCT